MEGAAGGSWAQLVVETYKCPFQDPCEWVVEDVPGALCLEGAGPGLVMMTLQPCPIGSHWLSAGDGLDGSGDVQACLQNV